jgi:hypothetical protein
MTGISPSCPSAPIYSAACLFGNIERSVLCGKIEKPSMMDGLFDSR